MLYVDIKKNFKDFHLDVKFQGDDHVLALLGASGCGKTLTLKCIAGVERPDEGEIILNGRTLFDSKKNIDLPPQKRNVGLLFQSYALFPNMTLEKNILIGIPKHRTNKSEIVKEKVRAFSLEGLENKYPSQLSGGQQQRTALARMLVNEPEVLLFDEPLSALDTSLRWQMEQELIPILKDHGGTTLYVSHNRDEVYRICDKVAIFNNGKIEELNSTEEVFRNPQTVNGAILTGCKNISRIRRLGDKKIYAIDWDLELNCSEFVDDSIEYVGVRSHNIEYYPNGVKYSDKTTNVFNLKIKTFINDLFSDICVLSNNGNPSIYMYLSKEMVRDIRQQDSINVNIDPKKILLLYP